MGTKIGHYFDKQEEKYLPLVPQANSTSCGRVFITDNIEENSAAEEKAVVLSPSAVNSKITTLQEGITSAYQAADAIITSAYEAADVVLEGNITKAYETADSTLKQEITGAYEAADSTLKQEITKAYETADSILKQEITGAYEAADSTLKQEITSGTVAVAKKLETENEYTGAKILNFTGGIPSWYNGNIGDSTQPVYIVGGAFSTCSGTMHNTTEATIDENATTSVSLGNSSVSLISNVTLAMEGDTTTGHIQTATRTNLSLNKANNTDLGGVKTGKDLAFTSGEGTVANLNLSSVTVDGGSTTLQDTLDNTYLKKSGDTFTGSLIGDQSNIIFTGNNNGLLWRLDGVDYDLLKTNTIENGGHIYELGSAAFDTHIKGTSLHFQPSSGYLYINGAQGNNILHNASGITLGNNQSILHLLSNSKGIDTNYPVQMHAARYHLHEGLGSGTSSHTNGVPITYTNINSTLQNRSGACLPLQLYSATSPFMSVIAGTESESNLFSRVYYWGDGSDSNSTGYDLAENALVAKYGASLLISGAIYANQLEAGSSIGGQIVYSTDEGETFSTIAGRIETRLPTAATTGHVVIPPIVVKVAKGSRIGLRCYTYTKSGYIPTHASDGTNITARTHLDIVCLGLTE